MAAKPPEFSHCNMLHSERLGTFLEAGWPNPNQSFLYLCTPQKLAQAGLEYHAHGEARCVVCFCIVKDLEPTSDPWYAVSKHAQPLTICHANTNAECALVLLGKPSKPDDYSCRQFLDLVRHRQINFLEAEYQKRKQEGVKRIVRVLRLEARLLEEKESAEPEGSESPADSSSDLSTQSGQNDADVDDDDEDDD